MNVQWTMEDVSICVMTVLDHSHVIAGMAMLYYRTIAHVKVFTIRQTNKLYFFVMHYIINGLSLVL